MALHSSPATIASTFSCLLLFHKRQIPEVTAKSRDIKVLYYTGIIRQLFGNTHLQFPKGQGRPPASSTAYDHTSSRFSLFFPPRINQTYLLCFLKLIHWPSSQRPGFLIQQFPKLH